ncbi:hypothetical protein CL3_28710 [butyrate-producing bacterium SM4/1]|nr:hypothetical protein CL3_28710 [butyrate-producing bacterium SM4/1]
MHLKAGNIGVRGTGNGGRMWQEENEKDSGREVKEGPVW